MDQGLYRLDEVNEVLELSPGSCRFAEEKDCPLIERWFTLFEEDTGLPITPALDVKKRVALFIAEREVFLWEHNGKVVSMMKKYALQSVVFGKIKSILITLNTCMY